MTTRTRGMGSAAAQALRRPSTAPADEVSTAHSLVAALAVDPHGSALQIIRVSEIAEHPDNPRTNLGALDELADSIKSLGLRQPIVVVPVNAFNAANPDLILDPGAQWVVSRRAPPKGSRPTGRIEQVPAWVRPDLAGRTDASETFIAENVHRIGLAPLEEEASTHYSPTWVAHSVTSLAEAQPGARQQTNVTVTAAATHPRRRRIRSVGRWRCTGHRGGTRGDSTTGLRSQPELGAVLCRPRFKRLSDVSPWTRPSTRRVIGQMTKACNSLSPPIGNVAGPVAWRRLDADSEVAAARASGRLAGGCEPSGQFVYLEAAKAPTELGLTEQARLATDSRRSAARQLVNTRPSARAVSEALTDVVLFGRFEQDRALKLTQQWIGDSVGITTRDPLAMARQPQE